MNRSAMRLVCGVGVGDLPALDMARPSPAQLTSAAALISCLWMVLLGQIPSDRPAVEDEVNWLRAGDVTYRLVRDRAGPAQWETAYAGLASFGPLNPPLGKLAIGAALATVKQHDAPVRYHWVFRASRAKNLRDGNRVPPAHAQAARVTMSLFSTVSLALLVALSYQITGAFWPSLAAPALLTAFAAFEHSATRIYTDAPQLACLLGGMVAFQSHLTSRSWRSLLVAGVLMGLSVAVKYSSAPVIAIMGLFALFSAGSPAQRFARAALVGAIPVGVFIAVNPYLYPDPLGRTLEIISRWGAMMDRISQRPRWADAMIASPFEGLVSVARRAMFAPEFSFAGLTAAPWIALACLAALGWTLARYRVRIRPEGRNRELISGLVAAATGLAAFAAGWAGAWAWLYLFGANALAWRIARPAGDDARQRVRGFFLASLLVAWVATGLWLQLDWPRYSLRVLVLTPAVHAAGLAALGALFTLDRRHAISVGTGASAQAGSRAT